MQIVAAQFQVIILSPQTKGLLELSLHELKAATVLSIVALSPPKQRCKWSH